MTRTVIQVENLHKSYPTSAGLFPALKAVNLTIVSGEFVAIMGQSGSGKSTFMNIIGCLDSATQGRYVLDGRHVAELSKDELALLRNRTIGFVFQGFNLLQRMSLLDNVALPLIYCGVAHHERQQRALEMLTKVGLESKAHSLPNQISGGQQQRVAIARALVNRPSLILADEPTGNLDSHTSKEVMALFASLNHEGITIVLVTHESDIAEYAKRQVRFLDGEIVSDHETPSKEHGADHRNLPHPNPDEKTNHSTKPASGQVAGYPPKGAPKVGNPLSSKQDVELTQGANELREFHANGEAA